MPTDWVRPLDSRHVFRKSPRFDSCCSVFLEVLRLLKDLFVHLISVHGRVAVLREQDDQVRFQLGLDVVAPAPVGVSRFVVDHRFHRFGELDQLVLGILEIVFVGEGFEDVVV